MREQFLALSVTPFRKSTSIYKYMHKYIFNGPSNYVRLGLDRRLYSLLEVYLLIINAARVTRARIISSLDL